MKNVDMQVNGDILTIKINLKQEYGRSASGKSIVIATTEGNQYVPDSPCKIGLNVYRKV